MNFDQIRDYFLAKPDAMEDYPFGPEVAVYKVRGKMFATLIEKNGIARTNLKCAPDEALALRDIFAAITPGYHMNKRHWNTVMLDGTVPSGELERMIDNSYSLVVKSLPRTQRQSLEITFGRQTLYGKGQKTQ